MKAVLFDLDGTLLDTLKDLHEAVNLTMDHYNYPRHTLDEVRQYVGNGLVKLVERSVPQELNLKETNRDLFDKIVETQKINYNKTQFNTTCPYEGIIETLTELKKAGIKTAIVTNKPDNNAKDLAQKFFGGLIDAVAGSEDNKPKKPNPYQVLKALEILEVNKKDAVFVGDSDVDIWTGKNSGLKTISCCWGFRSEKFLIQNGAQKIISKPVELLEIVLGKKNQVPQKIQGENLSGEIARELDFYRIREKISEYASTIEGKEFILNTEPTSDSKSIEKKKNLCRQWNSFATSLNIKGNKRIQSFPEIKQCLTLFNVQGTTLKQSELFALMEFCKSAEQIRNNIFEANKELGIPDLYKMAFNMPGLETPLNKIQNVITDDGQLKELPGIREIKKKIFSLQREVENAMKKYTSDSAMNNVLQSNVPAYRSDRVVLAVKSEKRSEIKGIIHEVSSTGQTVFIEPEEVVYASNQLTQAEFELEIETRKILTEITEQLREYNEDFHQALDTIVQFDFAQSSSRYMMETNGVYADNSPYGEIFLNAARHPLLGNKAVPVDIKISVGKKIVIITGPNTGGKTVTLKTVALFALLNQAGFPLPAGDGTKLPVFKKIFADIGDEQSIDQSLSTFSSHMKKIASAVENADEHTLILLDELGSGTDPLEGGAIAMAVLDELIQKKSYVLVTTHHGILKNYGWKIESCINASVEFDTANLQPTYKLHMGIPGESHAIEIASKNGMNESIISKACSYIQSEQADVSQLIKGLTEKNRELEKLLDQTKLEEIRLIEKDVKLKERILKLEQRELEIKEMEKTKSTDFLMESRKTLENLIRQIREGEITREKTLAAKKYISDLTDAIDLKDIELEENKKELESKNKKLEQEKLEAQKQIAANGMKISKASQHKLNSKKTGKKRMSNSEALAKAIAPEIISHEELKFEPGAEVIFNRQTGTLISLVKNGVWAVQFGSIKMNVKEKDLHLVKNGIPVSTKTNVSVELNGSSYISTEKPVYELRLLGMRMDEAIKALEKQLDLCAVNNFKNFSVIHGKGNGILQQAVHDYLSHYPGVKEFKFAAPEDGGFGKTYVEMNI